MEDNSYEGDDLINEFYNDMKAKGAIEDDYEENKSFTNDSNNHQEYIEDDYESENTHNLNNLSDKVPEIDSEDEDLIENYEEEGFEGEDSYGQQDEEYAQVSINELKGHLSNDFNTDDIQDDTGTSEPKIFCNEYKPKKRKKILVEILEPISEPQYSVLKNTWSEHK